MPEPISSSAATSTLTGLALLFTLPGVDPSVVLGALTGAVLFISAAEEQGRLRRIALFVASFVSGLLLAGFTCQLLEVLLPASVQVSNAIGSLIASAMMVRLFQRDYMIAAVGQAGPRTLAALLGSERGNQLTINHMQASADLLAVPLATMATVAQVESIGEGFTQTMRPVVLFERHVFYKQLTKHQGKAAADQLAAYYPNLVNPKRGGYAGGAAEWERLQLAISLHRDAAIESASWGMFQIMGYNWQPLGFASASDWQNAMQRSEVEHLTALCRFIQQDPAMHKALQGRKWADFARRYNGPAFKENDYDTKLAKWFAHFTKVYQRQEVANVA